MANRNGKLILRTLKNISAEAEVGGGSGGGKMYWHQVEAYLRGEEVDTLLGVTWILLSTAEPLTLETLTELSANGFHLYSDKEASYPHQKILPQRAYYGNLGLGIIVGSDDEVTWTIHTEQSQTPIDRIEDTVIEA